MFGATGSRAARCSALCLLIAGLPVPAPGGAAAWVSPAAPTIALLALQQERYRERQVLDPDSDEWMDRPLELEALAEGELEQARALLAQGKPSPARGVLKKWIRGNAGHERYAEANYLLGEAEFASKRYYQAYEAYEIVVESTSGDLFYRALRREMDVARAFFAGEKRIVWGFLRLPAYDDGAEILGRVWERVPGTRMGEEALRLRADFRFERGEMDLAQDEYANLAREFPNGRFAQSASLRAAESAVATFAGVRFDDRPLVQAEERYRQVLSAYPLFAEREGVPERLEGIRRARADKDLEVARYYERTRKRAAAEFYYRTIVRDWPGTLAESEARSRLRALGVDIEPVPAGPDEAPRPAERPERGRD